MVPGITTYEPRIPEDTLREMLDVGIELVPSFDVENIERFPAIHRKAAMTGRGPPSLHGFLWTEKTP